MGWPGCLQGLFSPVPLQLVRHGDDLVRRARTGRGGRFKIVPCPGTAVRSLGSNLAAGLSASAAGLSRSRRQRGPDTWRKGRWGGRSSQHVKYLGGPPPAALSALQALLPHSGGSLPEPSEATAPEGPTSSSGDSRSGDSSDRDDGSGCSSSSSSGDGRGTAHSCAERGGWSGRAGTFALVGANVLAYLACMATADRLYSWGAVTDAGVRSGQLWRLLTYSLLHWYPAHLLVNMMSLSNLGPAVEERHGARNLFFIYATSALSGGAASFCLSRGVSAGASGAVYGLVGALAADYVREHGVGRSLRKLTSKFLLSLVAVNLLLQFYAPIDHWGHLGGLLGGAIASSILRPSPAKYKAVA